MAMLREVNEDAPLLSGIADVSIQAKDGSHSADSDAKRQSRGRLLSLDLLRGIIIIVMAWDHVKVMYFLSVLCHVELIIIPRTIPLRHTGSSTSSSDA